MGTRHFTHEHDLTLFEESEEILTELSAKDDLLLRCSGCFGEMVNCPVYFCQVCENYILHKSCFELPTELNSSNPLHSTDHPLILGRPFEVIVCNCCRNIHMLCFTYNCAKCEINLDVNCALHTNKSSCDHHQSKNKNLVAEVEHFLDPHKLVLLRSIPGNCSACSLPLSSDEDDDDDGACYGCPKCVMYLHKSCLEVVPQVIQHPYHPHPLEASSKMIGRCVACQQSLYDPHYVCSEQSCEFILHIPCATSSMEQTIPLRHKIDHHHELHCFVPPDEYHPELRLLGPFANVFFESICDKCDQPCKGAFYICFECNFRVHLECMLLPPKVDRCSCHFHPLTLRDSFREDDSGVYYCYACGEPRNGNYPVYFCEECPEDVPYVAHVECIICDDHEDEFFCETSRQIEQGKGLEIIESAKEQEGEQKGELSTQIMELQIGSHDHQLTFHAKEGLEVKTCYECKTEIHGGKMYKCEFCNIHFHPSCTKFPDEITRHTLHKHRLVRDDKYEKYLCRLCRNVCKGLRYDCSYCNYTVGVECAFLTDDQYQNSDRKHPEVKIKHVSHNHELTLAKCSSELQIHCVVCQLLISGLTYCCLNESTNQFFVHESCLEMKLEIQPSYHLPHRLSIIDFDLDRRNCGVCGSKISFAGYFCYECQFSLHVKCAADPTSTLKHKFHEHTLYSFAACDLWRCHDLKYALRCCKCSDIFSESFYRCVECDLSIHLECIPLPKIVKHSCHFDPLTLRSSFHEDDSGVYYCNACEEPRNPNHPVYLCEECWSKGYVFVAHVGCVIQEGDTSLDVLLSEVDINNDQQGTKSIEINQED